MFRRNFLAMAGVIFGGLITKATAAPIPKDAGKFRIGKWILVSQQLWDHPGENDSRCGVFLWLMETEETSNICGMNRSRFIGRVYINSTGHTVMYDINAESFEKAKEILINTNPEWSKNAKIF